MKPTILFLCPHSAAKSVMAAAYCQHLAAQYGLDLQADFAGTEPADKVAPAVAELLLTEGLDVRSYIPRLVSREELETAGRTISLGCDVSHLTPTAPIEYWDDIPAPSQALITARNMIYDHVEQLINQFKSSQQ